jgi:hypothetical protein
LSATSLSYFLPHPDELVRIVATLEAMVEPGDLVPLAEKRFWSSAATGVLSTFKMLAHPAASAREN